MSILSDLHGVLTIHGLPFETGAFLAEAPAKYIVITPLVDTFDLHADNAPGFDIQEARLSLYAQGSYTKEKNRLVRLLLQHDFTITERRYIGFETETGYHHYAVDVAKSYKLEE